MDCFSVSVIGIISPDVMSFVWGVNVPENL